MNRSLAVILILLGIAIDAPWAVAQDASLSEFFGRWQGTGISEQVTEAGDFAYAARDLDIDITPSGDAFAISWTTDVRGEGGSLVRKEGNLEFRTVRPGVFESTEETAEGLRHAHTWARMSGASLIVYVLEIDEAGVYELSQYVRTITSVGQMQLGYTRQRDGRPVRTVTAMLSRIAQ